MTGRSWITAYVCARCGSKAVHVELSPVRDQPEGLPFDLRWCGCGGFLVVDRDESTWPDVRRRRARL